MKKELQKYVDMSPFELKNVLIQMAQDGCVQAQKENKKAVFLNAGRGNPNFSNTTARQAFAQLNLFACEDAKNNTPIDDLGLRPEKSGISKRCFEFLDKNIKNPGAQFLKEALNYAIKEFSFDAEEFVFEMTDAALGDFYPSPPRIFPHVETVLNEYLVQVLSSGNPPAKGKFDLFATEGATAAMIYIFKSLRENKLLKPGDSIAILTPIFSPYLEIPILNDYKLVEVLIESDENMGWQVPDSELEKIKDNKIKAFFMVHPTNPTSIRLNKETLEKIAQIIKNDNKDLIFLTDTVYATFVDDFYSLVEVVPRNTLCVYSFSKFFGVTGWRLGVIMLHEDNVIDDLISKLPKEDVFTLHKRYKMDAAIPEKIKFIERLEMDSRDVALAHTGGLSCPQQCIMCLFALFYLTDKNLKYKKSILGIIKKRVQSLYDNLGLKLPVGPEHTYYYMLIDISLMAEDKHGKDFAKYLTENFIIIEFLFRLAKEKYTICLPGKGFAGPDWSLRVSLANLNDDDYTVVGKNISDVMEEYYREWNK